MDEVSSLIFIAIIAAMPFLFIVTALLLWLWNIAIPRVLTGKQSPSGRFFRHKFISGLLPIIQKMVRHAIKTDAETSSA